MGVCVLLRPAVVLVKLKRKLQYRGHVYFERVRPEFVQQILQYLKCNNHLYKDLEIDTGNIPNELINICDNSADFQINSDSLDLFQQLLKDIDEPIEISLETESRKSYDIIHDNELEYVENPLDVYRVASNETTLMSLCQHQTKLIMKLSM